MPHGKKEAEEILKGNARQADSGSQDWKSGLKHGMGMEDKAAGKQMHVERTAEYGSEPKPDQNVMGFEMGKAGEPAGKGNFSDYGDSSTSSDMGARIEPVV